MKFSSLPYQRPDITNLQNAIQQKADHLAKARNAQELIHIVQHTEDMLYGLYANNSLARIRYDLDMSNTYYDQEVVFLNQSSPLITNVAREFYQKVLQTDYQNDLRSEFGQHFLDTIALSERTTDPSLIALQQEENRLTTEQRKILANLAIPFKGKSYNMLGMRRFKESADRNIRREAADALYVAFAEIAPKAEDIFNRLVQVRHRQAQALGYQNFVELGYYRRGRLDYTAADVAKFRQFIAQYFTPIAQKMRQQHQQLLGYDSLHYYDSITFPNGDAQMLQSDKQFVLDTTRKIFAEMSPELVDFLDFMQKSELLDLDGRIGKYQGGYNAYIAKYGISFILANFNGTQYDVHVLVHELGHAYQKYKSHKMGYPSYSYSSPTTETAEIHSMGLEMLFWDKYHAYFGSDTTKFQYEKMSQIPARLLTFALGDHFQEMVYENPDMTPAERNQCYADLRQKYNSYVPQQFYDECPFLSEGKSWQMISHFFFAPFYYIDYGIAELCALQLWRQSQHNFSDAWQNYEKLCKIGGSMPFTKVLAATNLQSPFNETGVAQVAQSVQHWLDNVSPEQLS